MAVVHSLIDYASEILSLGGEGDSHIKVTGMLTRKFKLNPYGRPMWVWLNLELTPKGDFCVISVRAFFVNFFTHITKQYLNGQI